MEWNKSPTLLVHSDASTLREGEDELMKTVPYLTITCVIMNNRSTIVLVTCFVSPL